MTKPSLDNLDTQYEPIHQALKVKHDKGFIVLYDGASSYEESLEEICTDSLEALYPKHVHYKPSWDHTFFDMIDVIAKRSDDPNTKLGAIIVSPDNDIISIGYNGLPRGIDPSKANTTRPTKYAFMAHAEENAILNCVRNNTVIPESSRLYVQMVPCVVCTRAIIQSGIKMVVIGDTKSSNPKWEDDWKTSQLMLVEAGVSWRQVN